MSTRTIIRTVITPRAITRRVGPAGAGGGATTFAALTDKATADLPAINTPLASALSGKQPLDADLTSWAGVTRAAGFDTFTATPSSANLRALVTDETGTGPLVFGTGPTFAGLTNTGMLNLAAGTTFTYGTGIASAHRTALGLGSLATQSGTFSGTHSGTSSGTNTGDQDLSGLVPRLSTLTVSGISDSGMGSALTLTLVEQSSLVNGRRSWLGSGATLFHDTGTGAWRLEYSDIDTFYFASIVDDSQEPWKLTGWTEEQGSGQPNFSLTPNALQPIQSSSGTIALTQSLDGEPDRLTNGYIRGNTVIDDDATWTYGTNSAEAHRIALGAGATGSELFGAATAAAARTTMMGEILKYDPNAAATRTNPATQADDDVLTGINLTAGIWEFSFYFSFNVGSGGVIPNLIFGTPASVDLANTFIPGNYHVANQALQILSLNTTTGVMAMQAGANQTNRQYVGSLTVNITGNTSFGMTYARSTDVSGSTIIRRAGAFLRARRINQLP